MHSKFPMSRRRRCLALAAGLLLAIGLSIASPSVWAGPPTRADIDKLAPEEKAALLQKKERFEALSSAKQEQLRKLDAEIAASQQSKQLYTTLDRYHEWLKTLTSVQRVELLELPTDERIVRIKELMQEQERKRLRDLGGRQLPEADTDAIFSWLEDFMKQHEEQYLERLPKDFATKLRNSEEVARRRSLMRGIVMRGPRGDFPLPTPEDLERLLPKLSQPTRTAFESVKTPDEKQYLARHWVFSALVSKVLPPASDEDLQKVFNELPPDQRERLERKTPDELKRELTAMFHWRHWPGREGWRGGPGGGGFRPGGGPNGPGPGNNPGPPGPPLERGGAGERGQGERGPNDRGPGERGPGERGPGGRGPMRGGNDFRGGPGPERGPLPRGPQQRDEPKPELAPVAPE